ncbi:MAG: MotA/TolQ/ExbB proton channel family protein [Bacteroidetes bacterium]|jgi:biopolymer transport protein ExbB|nr:MotA/TolQ/ExbB proton channel family protein [Bacteroidota bacterium]MBT5528339.1 MotA/TolQ/ExbB proton channel family protein [Cytophagia bacterium]MBT3421637.1 MotA/TolQ/ExbB proton channel family protein [Bacteroidota bacterium]MBT3799556.1 MotA/TolQ/ExbB proton channel family protein [Bacteroidota bacterium]MBT3933085.1 MotA/TolQ/ExbB proton channel family protein [Bacteroidota bacterium]
MRTILLQTDLVATEAVAAAEQTVDKLRVIELLIKGGWIMIPIILLGIIGIYIFIERYLVIQRSTKIDDNFMNKIRDLVIGGNIEGARSICMTKDSPVARMMEKGISRIGNPLKDISTSVENVANLEVFKLEKRLATLGTISGAAPMIGFLGTVTGMIEAFYKLSKAGGNNIDPQALSGGIYEAMVTTASGLAVGILAFIGYNILSSMIKKVVFKMEATAVEFIDVLHEPI